MIKRTDRVSKTCRECNREYQKEKYKNKIKLKENTIKQRKKTTSKKIEVECVVCKKIFLRYPSDLQERNFCSSVCFDTYRSNAFRMSPVRVSRCKMCNKTFIAKGVKEKAFCSINCRLHYLKASKQNSKLTQETKRKISESQKKYCKENGNQFTTGKSKGKHSDETISKMSASNCGKPPRWKGRRFVYSGINGTIIMRSSYELAFANFLDSQGIKWQYEPIFKLSNGSYFMPDFQLDDGKIIEVKGFWTEKALAKWELFCVDYAQLHKSVMMKGDLQKIGLEV